jgi:hypothetical protein
MASRFLPCDTLDELKHATARLLSGKAAEVPFLAAGRPDLRESAAVAEELYDSTVRPEPMDVGLDLLGNTGDAEVIREFVGPLAHRWTSDPAEVPERASLLVCGLYGDIRSDTVLPLIGFREPDRRVALLTGRDLASLSWMIAKQYRRRRATLTARGIFGETDGFSHGGAEVFETGDLDDDELDTLLKKTVWRQLIFHSHGKNDLIHLGEWGLCGLSDSVHTDESDEAKPSCGYGFPCPKDKRKLVRATELRTAQLILSGCYTSPTVDAASYGARYQLVLAAIDGTAQTVVGAMTSNVAGAPELVEMLECGNDTRDVSARLNHSLERSAPYRAFLQYGFHFADTDPSANTHSATTIGAADPLMTVALNRAASWTGTHILPNSHPANDAAAKLQRRYMRLLPRVKNDAIDARLVRDISAIDAIMAERISVNPDDPVATYAEYWGDRSVVHDKALDAKCPTCGGVAVEFSMVGSVVLVPGLHITTCAKCGNNRSRFSDGPVVEAFSATVTQPGDQLIVSTSITRASPEHPLHCCIAVPVYLADCKIASPVRKAEPDRSTTITSEFVIQLSDSTVPQEYYFAIFAVENLAIGMARQTFMVRPQASR